MTTKKSTSTKTPDSIYVLRIDLAHLKPAVWRRLEVPAGITLGRLHHAIQMAFDWTDSHLHGFDIDGAIYGPGDPDPFGFGAEELDERKFRLAGVATLGSRFTYTYDFGDDWTHVVKIEKIVPPAPGVRYPRCTAGKNAAPPEDCGGPWGYAEMMKALADPNHPESENYLEWLGDDFEAKAFDIKELNAGLAMLKT